MDRNSATVFDTGCAKWRVRAAATQPDGYRWPTVRPEPAHLTHGPRGPSPAAPPMSGIALVARKGPTGETDSRLTGAAARTCARLLRSASDTPGRSRRAGRGRCRSGTPSRGGSQLERGAAPRSHGLPRWKRSTCFRSRYDVEQLISGSVQGLDDIAGHAREQ